MFLIIILGIIFITMMIIILAGHFDDMNNTDISNSNINSSSLFDPDKYVINQEHTWGEYTFRLYSEKDSDYVGGYEILLNNQVVYSKYSTDARIESSGVIDNMMGEGTKNVIISSYSGGAHCCHDSLILSINEDKIDEIDYLNGAHAPFEFTDLNGDGVYEAIGYDWTFAYWLTSFLQSPAQEVILEYKNGKYTISEELMKKPPPSDEEFEALRSKVDINGDENGINLWGTMINLIYTGHSDIAWKFINEVWTKGEILQSISYDEEYSKEEFIKGFIVKLKSSRYWPEINKMNDWTDWGDAILTETGEIGILTDIPAFLIQDKVLTYTRTVFEHEENEQEDLIWEGDITYTVRSAETIDDYAMRFVEYDSETEPESNQTWLLSDEVWLISNMLDFGGENSKLSIPLRPVVGQVIRDDFTDDIRKERGDTLYQWWVEADIPAEEVWKDSEGPCFRISERTLADEYYIIYCSDIGIITQGYKHTGSLMHYEWNLKEIKELGDI